MEWRIFFKLNQVIPMIIVDNLHYRLFHSVMWAEHIKICDVWKLVKNSPTN